jgi:hypothetical protein
MIQCAVLVSAKAPAETPHRQRSVSHFILALTGNIAVDKCAVVCVEENWKLCNWQYIAQVGTTARIPPLDISMDPQQIKMYEEGLSYETADASTDVWAVGTILYECLIRKSVTQLLPEEHTLDQVLH